MKMTSSYRKQLVHAVYVTTDWLLGLLLDGIDYWQTREPKRSLFLILPVVALLLLFQGVVGSVVFLVSGQFITTSAICRFIETSREKLRECYENVANGVEEAGDKKEEPTPEEGCTKEEKVEEVLKEGGEKEEKVEEVSKEGSEKEENGESEGVSEDGSNREGVDSAKLTDEVKGDESDEKKDEEKPVQENQ